jgi:hypothetical protein
LARSVLPIGDARASPVGQRTELMTLAHAERLSPRATPAQSYLPARTHGHGWRLRRAPMPETRSSAPPDASAARSRGARAGIIDEVLSKRKCVERQGDKAVHPRPEVARQTRQKRQAPDQTTQPHRDHLRTFEGLTILIGGNPLRQLPEDLPVSGSPRGHRLVLALTINEMP